MKEERKEKKVFSTSDNIQKQQAIL